MTSGIRIFAAFAMLLGVAFSAVGASAQVSNDATETSCVSADLGDQVLRTRSVERTSSVAVALPAGTISIPSARASDGYPDRVNITQTSEKYEVEFLSATGDVIAVSAPTGDVPDMIEFGEWIGSLGSVELSEPAVAIRAHHRHDLPLTQGPQSVRANEITFCFETSTSGPTVDPVCGDEGVTNNPDGTPCDTTPACGDEGVTNNPDGTPCDTTPACGDEGVTNNPDGTPCTTDTTEGEPTSPTVTAPTTTEGEEVAGPTTPEGTEVADPTTSTTEAPTTTTAAEEVAGPADNALPVTGSNSAILLTLGAVMLLAGGGLLVADRRFS